MPFPAIATLIDNFNRASLGANWGAGSPLDGGQISIVSSTVLGSITGYASGAYSAATYGPDINLIFDIPANGATGGQPILMARLTSTSNPAYGYMLGLNGSGGGIVSIQRIDSSNRVSLAQVTQAFSNGDKVGFEIIGSKLAAYRYTAGAWGAALVSAVDSTYSTAGYFGADLNDATVDNMSGGTVVTSAFNYSLYPKKHMRIGAHL